jgi:molybdopterin converting factor small subunit
VRITVRLFGVHRIGRFKEQVRDVPPGTTARAVVEALRLPTPLLGTILIKGVHAQLDDPLAEGDDLTILPILEGG